jgi:hypothetical protein
MRASLRLHTASTALRVGIRSASIYRFSEVKLSESMTKKALPWHRADAGQDFFMYDRRM